MNPSTNVAEATTASPAHHSPQVVTDLQATLAQGGVAIAVILALALFVRSLVPLVEKSRRE